MLFANVLEPSYSRAVRRFAAPVFVASLAFPVAAIAQVREIQIAPAQLQIQPGEQKSILVTAFDATGNVVTDAEFTWSVDESIVRVTHDETTPNILYVEGLSRGQVRLTVSSRNVSAAADLTVLGADLTGVPMGSGETAVLRIDPETIFLLPTEEAQLLPMFLRSDGSPAARTMVTWRSLLESVSTVNASGMVVGISPGQGVIEAQAPNGVVGRALIRVDNAPLSFTVDRVSLAPLASDTLEVVVKSQESRTVVNRQLRWGSSDPTVVNVSPMGVVTGIRAGSANVVIQGFGQQHEIQVVVHRRVATMDISPPRGNVTVPLGGYLDFEAILAAEDGTPVPEAPIVWGNSDPAIASIDTRTGRVTGLSQGVTTLSASGPADGLRAEWSVNVVAGGIEVDFDQSVLSKGAMVPVPVWIHDTSGKRLQRADHVTWASRDSAVAFVRDTMLQVVGWGTTYVVATTPWGGADSILTIVQGELLVTSTRSGNSDIFSMRPHAVDDLNRVTMDPGAELDGTYSRDGRHIAYTATGGTNSTDLYVVETDGNNPRRLTATEGNEGSPSWLTDGRIVYQLTRDNVTHVWAIDLTGENAQQLTAGRRSSDQPDVSPDGTRIAFRQEDQIYIIGPDGTVAQITDDGRYRNPHWFPDGSLGYIAERRVNRTTRRILVKRNLENNVETELSPGEWPIVDWAVARDGETFALVVQETVNEVLTQGMWIVRIRQGEIGEPVHVPRVAELEQFLFPAFRW